MDWRERDTVSPRARAECGGQAFNR